MCKEASHKPRPPSDPWQPRRVIASNHHPLYSTDTSFKEYDQMRQQLEPLMYQYGVDMFFNGHVHSYERYAYGAFATLNRCHDDAQETMSSVRACLSPAPGRCHLWQHTVLSWLPDAGMV